MKVLITVRGLRKREGGPTYSVPALARALAGRGHDVTVLVDEYDIETEATFHLVRRRDIKVRLEEYIRDFEVVHDNGVWLPFNHAIAMAALKAGVPRVISPRGGLQPWVLKQNRWKKILGWILYQKSDLLNAAAVVGTAEIETRQVLSLGYKGQLHIIPNGTEELNRIKKGKLNSMPRRALFLSRLHPNKGIKDLIRAWIAIKPTGWVLDIVGPDEAGIISQHLGILAREGLADEVIFHGPKFGSEKNEFFNNASIYLLPTYGENFGNSVVEAMLMGVPVLTTTETPWTMLEVEGIGWIIRPGADELTKKLQQIFGKESAELVAMGDRALEWSTGRFSWDAIALQMEAVYGLIA